MVAALILALTASQFIGPGGVPASHPVAKPQWVFQEDATTTVHFSAQQYKSGTLTPHVGLAWSTQGAVPTGSGFRRYKSSIGTFSDTNYLKLGTGLDALDFQGQGNWGICVHVKDTSTSNSPVIVGDGQAGVAGWYLQKTTTGDCSFNVTSGSGTTNVATSLSDTTPGGNDICCFGWQGSNILVKKNLGPTVSASGAAVGNSPATTIPATLGRYPPATGFGYSGVVYELLGGTSTGDAYFSAQVKRAFAGLSQIGLAALGDSITYGYLNGGGRATSPYPGQLSAFTGSPFVVTNDGFSGYQVSQMQTVWTNNIQGRGYGYAVFLGGVNDIRGGISQSTTIANTNALLDAIRADGSTLIIINILPCAGVAGWTAGNQTELVALNANLASYASTNNVRLVDAYTAFGQSGNATFLATAYDSGDGLHPNQAGYNLLASLVKTALGY